MSNKSSCLQHHRCVCDLDCINHINCLIIILGDISGINNIADEQYFTRRAGGYPDPGLMPANGRTAFVCIGAKF